MADLSKRVKLVYDVKSAPNGLDIGNLVKIYEMHNTIFWDSDQGGMKPRIYGTEGHEYPLAVVDVAGKEMDLGWYTKQFADKEFWDKELHNCKNSPIYFWSNYGTSVWPHTADEMSAYLKEIGMDKVVAKDDDEAKKLWDKQKAKVKIATDKFTIEFLKERKAVVDIVKNKYDQTVRALEVLLKEHVKLAEADGVELEPRKQIANLMEKVRRNPVLPQYSAYRNKKGKWDVPMLLITSYDVLLQITYDVLKDNGRIKELVGPATTEPAGSPLHIVDGGAVDGKQS
jgi:hypothetical protein